MVRSGSHDRLSVFQPRQGNAMSSTKFLLAASFTTLLYGTQTFADNDHPLIASYPDAKSRKQLTIAYETFTIPTSTIDTSTEPYKYTNIKTQGDLDLHFYEIRHVSSLKVYENYMAAIKKLGFNITFSCQLETCGTEEQAEALGALISAENSVYNEYRNPYYMVAEKQGANGKIVAAWFIGAYEDNVSVQQVISEETPAVTSLINVDPSYLTKAASNAPSEKADADELAKDHKLLARYPNARLRNYENIDSETFSFPLAANATDKTQIRLTGNLSRHFYEIKDVSTLKIFENYHYALNKAGFDFLSVCKLDECGSEETARKLGEKISIENAVYNEYRKPYYMLAKKADKAGNIYVALFIGGYESDVSVQQVILQEKAVETGLISIDADSLKQQIDADGKALIYGIYFDTGKSTIKPESKPTLDAISQLLTKNKELLLYVVGHTDDTGAETANVELSLQRATAVVNELTTTYRIPAARLKAQGVGPYAPAGNNTSETGKQKNRRVELVKRLH